MDVTQMEGFVRDWLDGWNRRDPETLVSHYADDVEFHSQFVVKLLGEASGVVRGKANVQTFFGRLLAAFPGSPELELQGLFLGQNSLVIHYQSKGRHGAELWEFNAQGNVHRAVAHNRI